MILKNYIIVEPPVKMDFDAMSHEEAKLFMDWFCYQWKPRIEELLDRVTACSGFEDWFPDETTESLLPLGDWFKAHVVSRPRTKEEIETIYKQAPDWFRQVKIDERDLDLQTLSLCVDIAMYLSRVFLKNIPGLQWYLEIKRKNDANYHYPTLEGFGRMRFNPITTVQGVAYGFVDNSMQGNRLKEIVDFWQQKKADLETGGSF